MNINTRMFGNILIITSLLGFGITFYPIIQEELAYRFNNQELEIPDASKFSIRIPSIGIVSQVIANVDPFDQSAYQTALEQGIAHAQGTALPNQDGSVYLFAHSSDNSWNLARSNAAFFRLNRVEFGDTITLTYKGMDYQYKVIDMKEVWPNEVEYLLDQTENQLILQTCTPIGTDLKRLLVFAERE